MPTSQSFASPPSRARSSTGSAQAAAAQAVLDRPNPGALFPQLEEKVQTPSPAPARALSRLSCSEPLMLSSFGKAASSADKVCASELSAATTAFIPPSHIGEGSAVKPELSGDGLSAARDDSKPQNQEASYRDWGFRTESVLSVSSDWKLQMWRDSGKGLAFSRGLRNLDISRATANSPGKCVVKATGFVPNVAAISSGNYGPVADKQAIIDNCTKQLRNLGVELTEENRVRTPPGWISTGKIAPPRSYVSESRMSADMGRRASSEASGASRRKR